MITRYIEEAIKQIPALQETGQEVARSIHEAIMEGGDETRDLADLLHGVWLGHPLHPVLTDIVIGAWTAGTVMDGMAAASGDERAQWAADKLTWLGLLAAIPTAITGLVDYSTAPKPALRVATLHALVNDVALTLYAISLWQRHQGNRSTGVIFSLMGMGLLTVGGWLGGHLSYGMKVGVDHSEPVQAPQTWTALMPESELLEHASTCVTVEGREVLLYRFGGTVYATAATCPHAGGPLEKGEFDGFCVQCPWHDSVFDLRDGSVVHGPSTYPLPQYAARIHDGQIEIRAS